MRHKLFTLGSNYWTNVGYDCEKFQLQKRSNYITTRRTKLLTCLMDVKNTITSRDADGCQSNDAEGCQNILKTKAFSECKMTGGSKR